MLVIRPVQPCEILAALTYKGYDGVRMISLVSCPLGGGLIGV